MAKRKAEYTLSDDGLEIVDGDALDIDAPVHKSRRLEPQARPAPLNLFLIHKIPSFHCLRKRKLEVEAIWSVLRDFAVLGFIPALGAPCPLPFP